MSDHEYLKDGVWYGKRPPSRFLGVIRIRHEESVKTEPTSADRDHKGRVVGHVCCLCPNCAAFEANWCSDRVRDEGRLFA